MTTSPRYLTLAQVAERLCTPLQTVRYWCHLGKLRAYKPGRHPLVSEADLEAFVASSEIGKVRGERVKRARVRAATTAKRGAA